MASTLRRLGEDVFKGVTMKGTQDNSLEHSVENKAKTAVFFKSSSLPLRFLSTLIVLRTVTQGKHDRSLSKVMSKCYRIKHFFYCQLCSTLSECDFELFYNSDTF
jgi:hypothetical protein